MTPLGHRTRRLWPRGMLLAALACACLLAACGRPLTAPEIAFAEKLHGEALDTDRVRLVRGALVGSVTYERKPRPRLTCRERLYPPVTKELVTVRPAAIAVFNRVYFTHDWYLDDYTPEYPERLHLVEAMLLGHELTHVWQWQNRARTGYHPFRAATEHRTSDDPYLFDLETARDFLSFGFEQQGAIVEEYICCRALAPKAARTQRLHDMLAEAFPVSRLPQMRQYDVYLPWDGVEIGGICE